MADDLVAAVRAFAFGLPDAWEDHPWGESVAKVGKKVFVFFGTDAVADGLRMSVKLPESHEEALAMPFATPTGYGLERGHWVTVDAPEDTPLDLLTGWVEESYRAVAPSATRPARSRSPRRSTGRSGR
jgi:predicted DNA-binding protein (MmcQ/YjbR family)